MKTVSGRFTQGTRANGEVGGRVRRLSGLIHMSETITGSPTERTATTGDTATVLVVDDDEAIADLFTEILEGEYEVTTAYGGEEALRVIDDRHDVILLDRQMPDRNGGDVLAELRARGYECRVAMVTAVEPDLDIIEMPFDDYLVKPVSKGEIAATVERLFLLGQYQERHFELSSKRVKRTVLQTELGVSELGQSEEFAELQARIEELEAEMHYIEAELDEVFSLTPYPA